MAPALLISLILLGPGGEGGGEGSRVEWTGSEACPGAELAFERSLDRYVGEAASDDGSVVARARIVERGGHGLRLQLTLESAVGGEEHELVGLGCEALIDQAALLLAGAIDPFVYAGPGRERMQEPAVPIQRPTPAIVVVAAPEHVPEAVPVDELPQERLEPPEPDQPEPLDSFGSLSLVDSQSEPPRRRAIEGSVGAAATGFVGLFPRVGGGVEVEGALERGALRWQNTATGWFGGRFRASDADVGGDLWALSVSSALCGVPAAKRIRVPLCAVGGVGFIVVEAVGTVEPRRSTRPWAYAGAEARFSVLARSNLAVGLGVGAHAALLRPSWEVRSPDVRYSVPPVLGLMRLTIELRGLGRDQNG